MQAGGPVPRVLSEGSGAMILISDYDKPPITHAHLMLEAHEILELMAGFYGLLHDPESHHDHVREGWGDLDLVVIKPGETRGFPPELAQLITEYFEAKQNSEGSS